MNAYLNRFKLPSTLCKQADAEPAGSRVCTKSAQMQGARRRSNARSVRRGAQRRSWALFVQTLRGGAPRPHGVLHQPASESLEPDFAVEREIEVYFSDCEPHARGKRC